ncbi:hypothetical protein Skr01_22490 [Sphaerisporangium krabiense]|uniref:Putative N-acyltransferase n=1 Tax=Sphaerisporangium krabiense TaxID=763782 RepID=A0A7W9DS31_9ACTN|nr:GNAT family N-acetyltransferase [Sphaerisporangium krabiense]MBB5628000.1 putative N-acyltransferase [Sphaerisporangium krabiense]GII62164.1 hypothetical protein Skr01_22490 [Sphaerisporangium krabiense]
MRAFAAVPGRVADWDRLSAGGPMFATTEWLDAMRGRVPGAAYTFALREAGETRLALYGTVLDREATGEIFDLPYILAGDPRVFPLSEASRAARATWRPPPAESWYPNLVVMLPGYECHALGPLAADPGALSELVGAIVAWAKEQELRAVAFLYTPPGAAALRQALPGHGFTRVPLSYSCELPLPGAGFDDYLAALPRKQRTETRRELRVLAAAGVRVRAVPVTDVPEDVVTLKCAHSAKYNGGPADRAKVRARLRGLCALRDPLLFRAERDGTLVGYGLFARYGDVWYCVSTGMDYARAESRNAYFATVFYEPVRLAPEAGVRRVHYGQATWRAKMSRGCEAVEMPGWVRAEDPALARVVADSAGTVLAF